MNLVDELSVTAAEIEDGRVRRHPTLKEGINQGCPQPTSIRLVRLIKPLFVNALQLARLFEGFGHDPTLGVFYSYRLPPGAPELKARSRSHAAQVTDDRHETSDTSKMTTA